MHVYWQTGKDTDSCEAALLLSLFDGKMDFCVKQHPLSRAQLGIKTTAVFRKALATSQSSFTHTPVACSGLYS